MKTKEKQTHCLGVPMAAGAALAVLRGWKARNAEQAPYFDGRLESKIVALTNALKEEGILK